MGYWKSSQNLLRGPMPAPDGFEIPGVFLARPPWPRPARDGFEMISKYILRISGAAQERVADVLARPSSQESGDWALELEEGPNDPPIRFVEKFLALLSEKFDALERIGVHREDITVWFLYEYDNQCNMEFSAKDLELLGDAGISLCVSCWQAAPKSAS